MVARGYNVYQDSFQSENIAFTLDNFKPFIQELHVEIGGIVVYDMRWECNGSCVSPVGGIVPAPISIDDVNQGMLVTVTASESMHFLDLSEVMVFDEPLEESSIEFLDANAVRTVFTWQVILDPAQFTGGATSLGDDVRFTFTGSDYAIEEGQIGNNLLNLSSIYHPDDPAQNADCFTVPTRVSVGQTNNWTPSTIPTGEETAHHFGFDCLTDGNRPGVANAARPKVLLTGACCPEDPLPYLTATIEPACTPGTGSIALSFGDAVPPFDVQWSSSSLAGNTVFDVDSGIYWATISDGNGCQKIEQFYVPAGPVISAEIEPATCLGDQSNDGAIHLAIQGSVSNYVQWSDGAQYDNMTDRENLPASDNYMVTVTSPAGCVVEVGPFSTIPEEPQVEYPFLRRLIVNAGGTPIYDGEWVETADGCYFFFGGNLPVPSALLSAMLSGTVGWEIQASFNTSIESVSIQSNGGGTIQGSLVPALGSDGQIWSYTVAPLYVGSLASGGGFLQPLQFIGSSVSGLPIYNMALASNNLTGCVDVPGIDPEACDWKPSLDANLASGKDPSHVIDIPCVGAEIVLDEANNALCVQAPGAQFSDVTWTLPSGQQVNANPCLHLEGAEPGLYCVKVKTSTGCVTEICATYCEPSSIEFHAILPCPGEANGSICLDNPQGLPISIEWEDDSTDSCRENLPAGNYCVTIRYLGCDLIEDGPIQQQCIQLNSSAPLGYTTSGRDACPGENNGMACVYPYGGTPPYTMSWFNGNTGTCVSNVGLGCWNFTITDQCGATTTGCVQIGESLADPPTLVNLSTDSSCDGSNEIDFQLSGGKPPFFYTLSNSDHTYTSGVSAFSDVAWGEYELMAMDDCGVLHSVAMIQMNAPSAMPPTAELIEVVNSCGGSSMGSISFSVTGGYPPYSSFTLVGPQTIQNTIPEFDEIPAGDYILYVDDACGIEYVLGSYSIPALNTFYFDFRLEPPCNEGQRGNIYSGVYFAGSSPYLTYQWGVGPTIIANTIDLLNVPAGTYGVTVTDQNTGCSIIDEVTLEVFSIALSGSTVIGETLQNGAPMQNGAIFPNFEGGNNGLDFLWNTGATNLQLFNLSAGTYTLTVTAENGCSDTFEFKVPLCQGGGQNNTLAIGRLNTIVTPLAGTASNPGYGQIDLDVNYDGVGALSYSWTGPGGFTSSSEDLTGLQVTGDYCVTVTENGCFEQVSECFTIIESCPTLKAEITTDNLCLHDGGGSMEFIGLGVRDESGYYSDLSLEYPLEWAALEWSTGAATVVDFTPGVNVNGFHEAQGQVVQSVFNSQVLGLEIRDNFGCPAEASALFNGEYKIGVVHYNQLIAEIISGTYEGVNGNIMYEFRGCAACGWEYGGTPNSYGSYVCASWDSDWQKAKFYPTPVQIPSPNVCQQGGTLKIDATVSHPGYDDLPIQLNILIPQNGSARFVDDEEDFEGCVFPVELFDMPPQMAITPNLIPLPGYNPIMGIFAPLAGAGENPDIDISVNVEITVTTLVDSDCEITTSILSDQTDPDGCPYISYYCNDPEHEDYNVEIERGSAGGALCRCLESPAPNTSNILTLVAYCVVDRSNVIIHHEVTPNGQVANPLDPGMILSHGDVLDLDECPNEVFEWFDHNNQQISNDGCWPGGAGRPSSVANNAAHSSVSSEDGTTFVEQIFPNPFSNEFDMVLNTELGAEFELAIFNQFGETVFTQQIQLDAGRSKLNMRFQDHIPSGLYYITLKSENHLESHRIIYQKN